MFTDTNECASNPCSNDDSCTDVVNGYKCNCLPGYTGVNCETGKLMTKWVRTILHVMVGFEGGLEPSYM